MALNIIDIADQHGLIKNRGSRSSRPSAEVLYKCPFCQEDSKPAKMKRFYLSLNEDKQCFKCWFCLERGGVFRFISLLEGVSEQEIAVRYSNPNKKILHPAEKLTRTQKRLMGMEREPNWDAMKKRDQEYYLRTLDLVWKEWERFVESQRTDSYFYLLIGIHSMKYQEYIEAIARREKELGVSIVKEILEAFSQTDKPDWAAKQDYFFSSYTSKSSEIGDSSDTTYDVGA
ncbi:hypothetical protein [Paenibacillus agricola]|uniref:Zinc finger CHC2-type domain-containing protein n=1 Tax=Paenibacillus agricola TaxID=2716264 RepID=A0ABX0JJ45_9BACL|nr:hypothetical protein [Paenibacillus agricola]NHN35515.1 hypothetical protein [Paenibacillus agricola]